MADADEQQMSYILDIINYLLYDFSNILWLLLYNYLFLAIHLFYTFTWNYKTALVALL